MMDHDHSHDHRPAVAEHRMVNDGTLRAAVFGLSDGLVSNTALVLGVASAADSGAVMVAGVAGLLAGAASMAAGEWISMTAQREALQRELDMERAHLDRYPEDEQQHMLRILQTAGLSTDTAAQVVGELARMPEENLAFHARVELGIDPEEMGAPVRAAVMSFVAFALGAAVPLLPWLLANHGMATVATGVASAIALLATGAMLARFTGRGAVYSGVRQLLIGAVAAALTMGIGALVGVQV